MLERLRQDEAVIVLLRLQLIKIIQSEIFRRKWSQRDAAKILGVAQPRIAEISAMATEKFSVEILIKFLYRLGLKAGLTIKPGKQYVPAKRIRKTVKPAKKQSSKPQV